MTVDLNLNYDLGYETGNLSVTFRLVQIWYNRSFVSFKTDNCWLWLTWSYRTYSASQEVKIPVQYIFILVAPIWLIHIDFIITPLQI